MQMVMVTMFVTNCLCDFAVLFYGNFNKTVSFLTLF